MKAFERRAGARMHERDDISRWRTAAKAAAVLVGIQLVAFAFVWEETFRPLPPRGELVPIDGIVEKMRIDRGESCATLGLRIETGGRRVKAGNWVLCHGFPKLRPLPPGAPVSVLVEPTPRGNLIWELRSGSRQLIPYEMMHAARMRQQRAAGWVRYLLAAICLPLVGVMAVWLWKELSRLARSTRSSGTAGRWV